MVNTNRIVDAGRLAHDAFPPRRLDCGLNQRGNSGESKTPTDELMDPDLIGGVENRRSTIAALQRLAGQCECREADRVRSLEGEGRHLSEIEARGTTHALGPSKAVRNRNPHVGRSELGDEGTVTILDDAMHDRLRMDDDIDLV